MSIPRIVALRGATGKIRTAKHNDVDHVVVPVVALLEGVIHPVNAPTPELVTAELFSPTLNQWNGRPLFAGHPMKNGVPVSGNSPEILESAIGQVFNAQQKGKTLQMEAWINPSKIKPGTDEERILKAVTADPPEIVEVSVGVFVNAQAETGTYGSDGKQYKSRWTSMSPDHLAMLIGMPGACSVAMGCGAPRVAASADHSEHVFEVTEEILEALGGKGSGNFGPGQRGGSSSSDGGDSEVVSSHTGFLKKDPRKKGYKKMKGLMARILAAFQSAAEAGEISQDDLEILGGPGSGNFGHAGRPGQRGGSASDDEGGGGDDRRPSPERSASGVKDGEKKLAKYDKLLKNTSGSAITTPGSHERASYQHALAASSHQNAANAYRRGDVSPKDPKGMLSGNPAAHARRSTEAALTQNKLGGTKPFDAEAAATYGKMALKAKTSEEAARYHELAAEAHSRTSSWHEKAKEWAPGGQKFEDARKLTAEQKIANYEKMHGKKPSEKQIAKLKKIRNNAEGSDDDALRDLSDDMSYREMDEELREALAEKYPGAGYIEICDFYSDRVIYIPYPKTGDMMAAPGPHHPCMMLNFDFDDNGDIVFTGEPQRVSKVSTWEPDEDEDSDSYRMNADTTLKAACGCGGNPNNNPAAPAQGEHDMNREARIKALAANPLSPIKNLKALEALSDEELTSLEQTAATIAKDKETLTAAQAQLSNLNTEEGFLSVAPQSIRDLVADKKNADAKETETLISTLKTAQSAYSEEELRQQSLPSLRKLATIAKVDSPAAAPAVNYAGQGVPRTLTGNPTALAAYAPPDPFAKK